METLGCRFPLILMPFLLFSVNVSVTQGKIARLTPGRKHGQPAETQTTPNNVSPKDFVTFFYTQTLDHFNYKPESYTTFQQRYVLNFKYWGGANASAPIFVFFGEEAGLDVDLSVIGFLTDNALRFKALLLYIEHRYYGKSIPFGSSKEALKKASSLGYFNSAQAIADYAAVILHVKKKFSAKNSPVIVIGGSYGGMLASWFRLKYPHIALGALASSAPILYFEDIAPKFGYYSIVSTDFNETSQTCYDTIQQSWAEIERVASKPNGLAILGKKFKTCKPLRTTFKLKDYLDSIYAEAAQYNAPPTYWVSIICGGIDGSKSGKDDILGQIFAGVVAYMGNRSCYDMDEYNHPTQSNLGWQWQTCSELVMPIGHESNTMFPPSPFNLSSFINDCKSLFGVQPKPHWITTYYGGRDIKLTLHRFASNIIFSNGLKDPYSSGGILENISDSIITVSTFNGSHCLDVLRARPSDPEWLVEQRNTEVEIIEGWISKYYADLHDIEDKTHI